MAFLNRDGSEARTKEAEAELNEALAAERPDELGAKLKKEDKEKGADSTNEQESPPEADGHNWQERYKNLQRYVQKVKDDNKKVVDGLTDTVNTLKSQMEEFIRKGAPSNLPETDEDLEELKQNNPAAFNSLSRLAKAIAEDIVTEKMKGLKSEFASIQQGHKANQKAANYIELQRRHPELNLEELNNSEQFQIWLQSKSQRLQDAMYGDDMDVDAASDVLDLYKVAFPTKKTSKKLVNTNEDVRPGGNPPKIPQKGSRFEFSESQIDEMDRKDHSWIEKNLDKIVKAQQEGRILLDISDPVGAQRALAAEAA